MQHALVTRRLLIILPLVLLLVAGCGRRDASWERVAQSGVLRVGLDPTFPPFELADDDGVTGLDVDLAHALAANLGLEAQFVYFGYDGLYDALTTGQVDVLLSALVIQPERTRDVAYSEPYFNAGEILLIPAGSQTVQTMADMNGRTLAVELGALGHVEATRWARQLPEMQILPLGSVDEAAMAVVDGRAAAALVDAVGGRLFVKQHPQLMRVPEPVTVEPYALVVRSEDQQLLARLDTALAALQASGELNEVVGAWLGD